MIFVFIKITYSKTIILWPTKWGQYLERPTRCIQYTIYIPLATSNDQQTTF